MCRTQKQKKQPLTIYYDINYNKWGGGEGAGGISESEENRHEKLTIQLTTRQMEPSWGLQAWHSNSKARRKLGRTSKSRPLTIPQT